VDTDQPPVTQRDLEQLREHVNQHLRAYRRRIEHLEDAVHAFAMKADRAERAARAPRHPAALPLYEPYITPEPPAGAELVGIHTDHGDGLVMLTYRAPDGAEHLASGTMHGPTYDELHPEPPEQETADA
jgi:hypothetical protein